jgi:maltooligosyltrehalose trehalohydrolase
MSHRKLLIGAEVTDAGIDFRVWAPDQPRLVLVTEQNIRVELDRTGDGYFVGHWKPRKPNARYQLELTSGERIPDPASRFQLDGPHGPSQVIDPSQFAWTDDAWRGRPLSSYILYEMHIGTFTPEGTWAAASRDLPELAAAGITAVEIMPVAEFPGKFGWGYDGVSLFAPTRLYGTPEDFRRFVDAAHRHEIAVILDVVYNHLGPDGNYLEKLSAAYFTDRHHTEWGRALNFDGEHCAPVREFFIANAGYWIDEFHLDGLRLDATQAMKDDSPPERHILTEIARRARAVGGKRQIVLIAENEPQHSELCRFANEGGYELDGLWNDDFHHSAMVALTGRREAYYSDYRGDPQEFVSAAKYGYLYQGQWYSWQKSPRGRPGFDLPAEAFITFIQNHDQIANSNQGLRVHQLTSPGRYKAFLALMMLGPGTPMLYQGQEFLSSAPFLFFADHLPELAKLVAEGRREFLSQFPSLTDPSTEDVLARPDDEQTFQRCKLDFAERETHTAAYRYSKDLIHLRRTEAAFRTSDQRRVDGAVLGAEAMLLRYFLPNGDDRLLLVNWGRDLNLRSLPEPLLAPPGGRVWRLALSSNAPEYEGPGVADLESEEGGWRIPGEAALWLTPAFTERD